MFCLFTYTVPHLCHSSLLPSSISYLGVGDMNIVGEQFARVALTQDQNGLGLTWFNGAGSTSLIYVPSMVIALVRSQKILGAEVRWALRDLICACPSPRFDDQGICPSLSHIDHVSARTNALGGIALLNLCSQIKRFSSIFPRLLPPLNLSAFFVHPQISPLHVKSSHSSLRFIPTPLSGLSWNRVLHRRQQYALVVPVGECANSGL